MLLNDKFLTTDILKLFTDSAKSLGFGSIYGPYWLYGHFSCWLEIFKYHNPRLSLKTGRWAALPVEPRHQTSARTNSVSPVASELFEVTQLLHTTLAPSTYASYKRAWKSFNDFGKSLDIVHYSHPLLSVAYVFYCISSPQRLCYFNYGYFPIYYWLFP